MAASLASLSGCGGGSANTQSHAGGASASRSTAASAPGPGHPASAPPVSRSLHYRRLFALAAPVQDAAGAALGPNEFVLLGGLTASDVSTDNVLEADLTGVRRTASLPNAQHDAQAAAIGGRAYLFGGGQFSQYDHILAYGGGAIQQVGALPRAASDVAVTSAGGTAYVVGGFDGSRWLDTILAWRPGQPVRVAGRLPVALRYAAVTSAGGDILIAGGSTPAGASRAVFRFDPRTGGVTRVATLPRALTHAAAGTIDGEAYVIGGRGDSTGSQTAAIWSIDPTSGRVQAAGRLPQPLSDTTAVSLGHAIIIAGGSAPSGTQGTVGELQPS